MLVSPATLVGASEPPPHLSRSFVSGLSLLLRAESLFASPTWHPISLSKDGILTRLQVTNRPPASSGQAASPLSNRSTPLAGPCQSLLLAIPRGDVEIPAMTCLLPCFCHRDETGHVSYFYHFFLSVLVLWHPLPPGPFPLVGGDLVLFFLPFPWLLSPALVIPPMITKRKKNDQLIPLRKGRIYARWSAPAC